MKRVLGSTTYQLFFISFVVVSFFFLISLPTRASAQEVSTQTAKVLGQEGSACAPMVTSSFVPYIDDGALHSFEFTVADPSYVALVGKVGDTSIPFQLITRRIEANGYLRIHVDIETTPINGSLPIHVTLLSARTDQPVCLSIVSVNVIAPTPIPETPPTVPTSTLPTAENTPVMPSKPTPIVEETPAANTTEVNTPTSTETISVVNSMQNPLRDICASEASAYRTWLILLVLFTLLVGGALWAEFPMSLPWARTPERIATIILGLLLALLAFWYFSVGCRAALWMPLLAFFIAVLGLLAAFWNHPRVTQLLLVEDSTSIKLPPAKAK